MCFGDISSGVGGINRSTNCYDRESFVRKGPRKQGSREGRSNCGLIDLVEGIREIAKRLMTPGKGIFAADATTKSITARLEGYGIATDDESRRKYRELLFTTPGMGEYISGVIMNDESIRQTDNNGKKFTEILMNGGLAVGIKVDKGTVDVPNFPGEKVALGLDGLKERLVEYAQMGAVFTKWRSVITIGDKIPTREIVSLNAWGLAQYAAMVQGAGMVPIVEPEVVMAGNHEAEKCAQATELTARLVFDALADLRVDFEGMIYKVNMVLPGKDCDKEISDEEAARMTVETLGKVIPVDCAGVVFLSGGQDPIAATRRLNMIVKHDETVWPMSFSFERALENKVMETWKGNDENWQKAQETLVHRAKLNSLAVQGKYEGE